MSDVRTTILVTGGILLGSFFSYLLQFFLGRTLSVSDYGAFNTLLSIASIVGVPATVFGTALIKEVASLSAKKETKKVDALFWQSMLWSTAAGVIIFAFFYIFSDTLLVSLKITNQALVIAFGFYLSLTFLWSVPYAYLQGLLKYKLFSAFVIVSSFLRFIFPAVYLLLDKNIANIFLAMSLATCVAIVLSFVFLKPKLIKEKGTDVWKELWDILKFSMPVMITNICLMSFNNNDLIMVRKSFDTVTSGYYAGTVTLGKILLFASTSVATVMFPKISSLKSKGEDIKPTFYLYLKMQAAVVAAGVLIFALFPRVIAVAFFGSKFLESVKYLPLFSVFIGVYVILNFLILFLFAVDITKLYYTLFFLVIAQVMLISRFNSSIYQVIWLNTGLVSVAVIIAFLYSYKFLYKRH